MRSKTSLTALLLALLLVVAACSSDDGDATTTTGDGDADDTATTQLDALTGTDNTAGDADGDGDADDNGSDTSTTAVDLGEPVIPEFEIVSRDEGDDGDTLVVVLDPTSYESLTDIDIQNVASLVVEEFPPVSVAHFVNDELVADLVLDPDSADAEGVQLLEVHYLAELEDGRLAFQGRFSDSGVVILGS